MYLNHRIIECLIGNAEQQLPDSPYITRVHTDSLLWHKESLINNVVKDLPPNFKYIFWIDADVIFTNQNWLVDSVRELQNFRNIVQPFEYCVHLNRNKLTPDFCIVDLNLGDGNGVEIIRTMKSKTLHTKYVVLDRKSTRLNSSHTDISRMPSSA